MRYHEVRVQQELTSANAELQGIHDELWLANQAPEVRAAVQQKRAEEARGRRLVWRGVVGFVLLWAAARALFGDRVGNGFASGAVWLLYHGLEWALMLGVLLWFGSAAAKGVRWLAGARPGGQ